MTDDELLDLVKGGPLLFYLRGPFGEEWKLYLDGKVEGFPPGTYLDNRATPLVSALIGKAVQRGSVTNRGEDRGPALSSPWSPEGRKGYPEPCCNTCSPGSSRTPAERLDLLHQVFERCSRLGLQGPLLSDLDDFLDGKTSVMPPADTEENRLRLNCAEFRSRFRYLW